MLGEQLPDLLCTDLSLSGPEPDVRESHYAMPVNDDTGRHTRNLELLGPATLGVETNLEIGMENLQESIRIGALPIDLPH